MDHSRSFPIPSSLRDFAKRSSYGSQLNMNTKRFRLRAKSIPSSIHQRCVPCGARGDTSREGRDSWSISHTQRAILQTELRKSNCCNGRDVANTRTFLPSHSSCQGCLVGIREFCQRGLGFCICCCLVSVSSGCEYRDGERQERKN